VEPEPSLTLSIHRAFVVRLHPDFDPADERVSGVVEHVVSSACVEFQSVDALLRFMQRVLNAQRRER
jgi:hypothetical protein